MNRSDQHIVVVGAGIVGACIAYELTRRGARVTIVDKGKTGDGATGNSFAWINASFSKRPWPYYLLNRLGIAAWRALDGRFGGALEVDWGGSLAWFADEEQAAALRAQVRRHQAWGYLTHLVDEDLLRKIEQQVTFGSVAAAAFSEPEGHVDPIHAAEVILMEARLASAKLLNNCEVTGLELRNGALYAIETSQGPLEADVVVVACGVDTPRIAAFAGVQVPLKESPGTLAHTKPMEPLLSRVVLSPGGHMKQKRDGRIVVGASFGGSPSTDTSPEAGEEMLRRASRYLPALESAELEEMTLGWRPLPADDYPIVGFAAGAPFLYLAVTHSGVTLGPLLGQLAATEILDGVDVELLQPYRLERFGR